MIRPVGDPLELPFLFKVLEAPHNPPGIPDRLSFQAGVDERTGRFAQVSSPALERILEDAYLHGSMVTGMMAEEGIGREYTDDFLSLLQAHVPPVAGARILEIGCGNGYLLSRFQALGAPTAIGIEPGPQADLGRERYGVDIRRGFFPSVAPAGPFDLIVAYCLLEHVSDPVALLRDAGRFLAPGGRIAVLVQDEEPYIRSGEFSLLFHEHFSYFSGRTLRRTLTAAGGIEPVIARSRFSNLLFGCCAWNAAVDSGADPLEEDLELATAFPAKAESLMARWAISVRDAAGQPGGAAVYVPGRGANYLARLDDPIQRALRLIDDNPVLRGTYLPGIPGAIEGSDTLVANPPAATFIMSLSFGARIAERLRARLPESSRILPLADLLEPGVR